MARLPIPGSDKGTWGDILNEYLSQTLEPDGVLKENVVTAASIVPNAITAEAIAPAAITPEAFAPNTIDETIIADGSITNVLIADNTIQEIKLDPAVQAKLNQTAPVTSVASKTGDVTLGLTDLTNTTITTPTNGQVLTYDSTISKWKNQAVPSAPVTSVASKTGVVTLIKDDVGLDNVDNTSDATKNAATATLTNKTIDADNNTISNLAHGAEVDDPSTGVHGVSGSVVGTTDTQTLTNKELTAPKIDSIKDTNGNTAFYIYANAGAVNYLQAYNTSGTVPLLRAGGAGADLSLGLRSKGTGAISMYEGSGAPIATFSPDTSAVNYWWFKSATTGSAVSARALGTDTNIDIDIIPKGSGVVQANGVEVATISGTQTLTNKTITSPVLSGTITGTYTFGGTPTFPSTVVTTTGTQTLTNKTLTSPALLGPTFTSLKDPTYSLNLFVPVGQAGAVNWFHVWNGATGSPPRLQAEGSDTNINIQFATKGSGYLNHYVPSGYTGRLHASGPDTDVSLDLTTKGAGIVQANGVEVATISGTQELTSKTITNPKQNRVYDPVNNGIVHIFNGVTSATNRWQWSNSASSNAIAVEATGTGGADVDMRFVPKGAGAVEVWTFTGQTPTLKAGGADANHDLNLVSKGTGTVQANGVDVATISATQTLTNKTITSPVLSGTISGTYTFGGTPTFPSTVVTTTGTQTLTNKTLTNPSINNYTEGVVAIGTVTTTHTLDLTSGTVQTATLTASTACTFTMPTATAGKSFVLLLKQAASTGNGSATFTGVKWNLGGAPTITATAGAMDILSFFADGTNWYGSYAQGYTP